MCPSRFLPHPPESPRSQGARGCSLDGELRLRGGTRKTDQGGQARIPTQGLLTPASVLGPSGSPTLILCQPSLKGALPSQVSRECLGTFLQAPPRGAWKAQMEAPRDRHQRGPLPAPSPQSLSHPLMPNSHPCSPKPHQGPTALSPFLFVAASRIPPTCPRVPMALRCLL